MTISLSTSTMLLSTALLNRHFVSDKVHPSANCVTLLAECPGAEGLELGIWKPHAFL